MHELRRSTIISSIIILIISAISPISCLQTFVQQDSIFQVSSSESKEFCIVIPSYNNALWYQKNLDSVFNQNYPHYKIIYIDDASSDNTGNLVEKYVQEKNQQHRVQVIKNTARIGALENIYNAVINTADKTVIVTLDGDDWLATNQVLSILNQVYTTQHAWLTYGTYQEYPTGVRGGTDTYPAHIVMQNLYRKHYWFASHLRTFYAGLFKKIKVDDLKYHHKFFDMTWDMAFMFPMLEMARNHAIMIPEVLYIYNRETPINDDKVNRSRQIVCEKIIRSRLPYAALDSSCMKDIS